MRATRTACMIHLHHTTGAVASWICNGHCALMGHCARTEEGGADGGDDAANGEGEGLHPSRYGEQLKTTKAARVRPVTVRVRARASATVLGLG